MRMKQGGDRKKPGGFTIVETLIVLAVTGLLFVSAVLLINGRQARTQFQTSINNLAQQVQQVINETQSGYYTGSNSFSCTSSAGSVTLSAGSAVNGQCVFVGKVLQFGTAADPSQLVTYPVVGSKGTNTTIAATNPVAVYDSASGVDASSVLNMQYGLTPVGSGGSWGMYYNGVAANQTGAMGFLAGDSSGNFASLDASGAGYSSGSQQVSLYAVKNTQPDMDKPSMVSAINAHAPLPNLVPATSVSVCVASGSTNQSGRLTVSSSLAVTLKIYGSTTCV